jgi:uncharacterized protein YggU (UPF0235/DUF167 family)
MNGLPDLSARALPGATFALRVQPRARADLIGTGADGTLTARVTAPPADGRANEAVRRLLARALGVAPTRLTLIRGETARDKVFRLD